jgi:amino acid transporter
LAQSKKREPSASTADVAASKWISAVSERFKTPANALFGGALVTVVFIGLEFASPTHGHPGPRDSVTAWPPRGPW